MLCEYSHKKSESLAQIHTTVTEIQHFFYGIVFYIANPVYYIYVLLVRLTLFLSSWHTLFEHNRDDNQMPAFRRRLILPYNGQDQYYMVSDLIQVCLESSWGSFQSGGGFTLTAIL